MPGVQTAEITVGVIGTGFGGTVHAPAFLSLPGVRVLGIAGTDLDRTTKVAVALGIPKAYVGWETLVEDDRISAISVAAPPGLHCPIVLAAVRRGKHILCEKPFGLNPAQAREMTKAATQAAIVHMVDFTFRMAPERIKLKELLKQQACGRILRANVEWTLRGRGVRPQQRGWQMEVEAGGGVLLAFGSHVIDAIEELLGPIKAVCGRLSKRGPSSPKADQAVSHAEDTVDLLLRLGKDIPVTVSISTATPGGRGFWLSVYGEDSAFVLGNPNLSDVVLGAALYQSGPSDNVLREVATESMVLDDHERADGRVALFKRIASRFVGAIRSQTHGSPTFLEGWRNQVVMDAVRQSDRERRWIEVDHP